MQCSLECQYAIDLAIRRGGEGTDIAYDTARCLTVNLEHCLQLPYTTQLT